MLENTSEANDESDYTLNAKLEFNHEGLRIFVGGQPLIGEIVFKRFPFGAHKIVVEVFRGPNHYDYSNAPITLNWNSMCDYYVIYSSIQLRPTYFQPCAKVEFHDTIKTFAISKEYVVLTCFLGS